MKIATIALAAVVIAAQPAPAQPLAQSQVLPPPVVHSTAKNLNKLQIRRHTNSHIANHSKVTINGQDFMRLNGMPLHQRAKSLGADCFVDTCFRSRTVGARTQFVRYRVDPKDWATQPRLIRR